MRLEARLWRGELHRKVYPRGGVAFLITWVDSGIFKLVSSMQKAKIFFFLIEAAFLFANEIGAARGRFMMIEAGEWCPYDAESGLVGSDAIIDVIVGDREIYLIPISDCPPAVP